MLTTEIYAHLFRRRPKNADTLNFVKSVIFNSFVKCFRNSSLTVILNSLCISTEFQGFIFSQKYNTFFEEL